MPFLHTSLCECGKSEMDLFAIPPTQTATESSYYVAYKPISSLDDGPVIEFAVPGTAEYIDMANTLLGLEVVIEPASPPIDKVAYDALTGRNKVGPVNNLMHSLFSQVDVLLNQKPVTPPNNAYPYKAYLQTLLNYGPAAKGSHLTCVGYSKDTARKMDDTKDANLGLVARREYAGIDQTVHLIEHIHTEVTSMDRFMINGVEFRMRLIRSRDTFCRMDTTGIFTARIKNATLHVMKVRVGSAYVLENEKRLAGETLKYPIRRVSTV